MRPEALFQREWRIHFRPGRRQRHGSCRSVCKLPPRSSLVLLARLRQNGTGAQHFRLSFRARQLEAQIQRNSELWPSLGDEHAFNRHWSESSAVQPGTELDDLPMRSLDGLPELECLFLPVGCQSDADLREYRNHSDGARCTWGQRRSWRPYRYLLQSIRASARPELESRLERWNPLEAYGRPEQNHCQHGMGSLLQSHRTIGSRAVQRGASFRYQ